MPSDPFEKLLRETDNHAGEPPAAPADLAARVVRRAEAQRRRRLAIGSAAAAVLLAAGLTLPMWRGRARVTVGPVDTAALAAQAAQLRAEADWRSAVARRTRELEARHARLAALRAVAAQPDPVQQSRSAVEQAAGIIFQQGDRLYRDFKLPQQAAESYREVLRLFPTSLWAARARERLTEIETRQGEIS